MGFGFTAHLQKKEDKKKSLLCHLFLNFCSVSCLHCTLHCPKEKKKHYKMYYSSLFSLCCWFFSPSPTPLMWRLLFIQNRFSTFWTLHILNSYFILWVSPHDIRRMTFVLIHVTWSHTAYLNVNISSGWAADRVGENTSHNRDKWIWCRCLKSRTETSHSPQ